MNSESRFFSLKDDHWQGMEEEVRLRSSCYINAPFFYRNSSQDVNAEQCSHKPVSAGRSNSQTSEGAFDRAQQTADAELRIAPKTFATLMPTFNPTRINDPSLQLIAHLFNIHTECTC